MFAWECAYASGARSSELRCLTTWRLPLRPGAHSNEQVVDAHGCEWKAAVGMAVESWLSWLDGVVYIVRVADTCFRIPCLAPSLMFLPCRLWMFDTYSNMPQRDPDRCLPDAVSTSAFLEDRLVNLPPLVLSARSAELPVEPRAGAAAAAAGVYTTLSSLHSAIAQTPVLRPANGNPLLAHPKLLYRIYK